MAEKNTNRTVMLLAGAVVVLLIAFVAVVLLNTGGAATPTAQTPGATASSNPSSTSNPGMAPSDTAFDPTKATKVPEKDTPKTFVAAYYQAIIDKKYDVAFKMQPAASQAGSVADFQSTQEMYGMKSFSIFSDTTGATDATVVVRQDLGTNGIWNASWTFVKTDGSWLVKARKVGMGEPTK
jgi:hypothetical protein